MTPGTLSEKAPECVFWGVVRGVDKPLRMKDVARELGAEGNHPVAPGMPAVPASVALDCNLLRRVKHPQGP